MAKRKTNRPPLTGWELDRDETIGMQIIAEVRSRLPGVRVMDSASYGGVAIEYLGKRYVIGLWGVDRHGYYTPARLDMADGVVPVLKNWMQEVRIAQTTVDVRPLFDLLEPHMRAMKKAEMSLHRTHRTDRAPSASGMVLVEIPTGFVENYRIIETSRAAMRSLFDTWTVEAYGRPLTPGEHKLCVANLAHERSLALHQGRAV